MPKTEKRLPTFCLGLPENLPFLTVLIMHGNSKTEQVMVEKSEEFWVCFLISNINIENIFSKL